MSIIFLLNFNFAVIYQKYCKKFHTAVQKAVVPLLNEINTYRKNKLGYDTLYPYDLEVDVEQKPPLKPFNNSDELVDQITDKNEIDSNIDLTGGPEVSSGARAGNRDHENNKHGGSWVDSFEDDSMLDWEMSDNIKVKAGAAKINGSFYCDSNTIALWHFDEGSGITAYDET